MAQAAFADTIATAQARLAANAPYLASNDTSVVMSSLKAFLQADADTNQNLFGTAPNITYTTATGLALQTKALDYGANASAGAAAIAMVVFFLQAAAASTVTILAGTVVGTAGDGITTPVIQFLTTANCIISSGQTNSGAPTPVICTVPGTAGNVAAGTILTVTLPTFSGIFVSNAASVNGVANASGAGVGGVNADQDSQIRSKIAQRVFAQNGAAQIQAAMIAAGAYDAYLFDPASVNATVDGFVYYYWCDGSGAAATITGATNTPSGAPDLTAYLAGATLAGLAATIDAAVRATLPVGILPRIGGANSDNLNPFHVVNLTAIPVAYSAPANVQSSVIGPLIQAAVVAYVQTLLHNQALIPSALFQYVQAAVGSSLSGFNIGTLYTATGATTPVSSAAAATTIYRCTGTPSSVVSLTRI